MYHQPLTIPFANLPVIQITDSSRNEYTGNYRFKKDDPTLVTVNVKEEKLLMTIATEPAFELLPVGKDFFKIPAVFRVSGCLVKAKWRRLLKWNKTANTAEGLRLKAQG